VAFDGMETEFFRSSRSRPRRAERTHTKREVRRRLRSLGSPDPAERTRTAVALVGEGLDVNAAALLDFVGAETDPAVREAVACAVVNRPGHARPDRPEAELRAWAAAEVAPVAPPAAIPPPPAASPAPPATPASATAPAAPEPPATPPVAPEPPGPAPALDELVLTPDDRWRAGQAPIIPSPSPSEAPPPPAATRPAVVSGTIGAPVPPPVPEPEADPVAPPSDPPSPTPSTAAAPPPPSPSPPPPSPPTPSPPTPSPPTPSPPPPSPEAQPTPAGWRIVKANPVDIVVWDGAESAD
jgi:hypothetical protein